MLGDAFVFTYFGKFTVNELLCIVVNNLFRYAIALDICEQRWSRLASTLGGIAKNQTSIIVKVKSE